MTSTPVTLDNCANEPIHTPEAIQPHGFLLCFSMPDLHLTAFSENLPEVFQTGVCQQGVALAEFIAGNKSCSEEVLAAANSPGRRSVEIEFDASVLQKSDTSFHAVVYGGEGHLVIELEKANLEGRGGLSSESQLAMLSKSAHMGASENIEALTNSVAAMVSELTGFDRVMVYKLDNLNNGHVLAEVAREGLDSFLGLHFPASDIPAQARRLYELNWIRMISDVDAAPVPIVPPDAERSRGLINMSYSMIRAVSPIHIEYLKNMGVQATMSISLLNHGKLWGLIACHHYTPHYVPQNMRLFCEYLGQQFSWQINAREFEDEQRELNTRYDILDDVLRGFGEERDLKSNVEAMESELLQLMGACGFVFISGNSAVRIGNTLSDVAIDQLVARTGLTTQDTIITVDRLSVVVDDEVLSNDIAGALLMPLSVRHKYFAIWFRSSITQTLNWAGEEAAALGDQSKVQEKRLTPRGSFSLFKETVKDRSHKWSSVDTHIAERFNKQFLAHVIERVIATEETIQKMKELDVAKDHFLASISHELRTPLNTIVGWSEVGLLNTSDAEQCQRALDIIKRSANTQAQLINDLLDLSRIASGTLKLLMKSVNVADCIAEVVESFSTTAEAKKIKVVNVTDTQTILGDEIRLKQIFSNLLGNAIKFTDKGGKIVISAYQQDSLLMVNVKDNGRGIAKDDMPLIFERFKQLKANDSRNGLGLGLSIVKHLVDLHGGKIDVASEGENKGSCFSLTFPVAPVNLDGQLDEGAELDGEAAQRLCGITVLVAEDEEDANRFISLLLQKHGAEVERARSGEQALEIMRARPNKIDLLLSDIGMPDMDGYELIKHVRDLAPEVKSVAFTAYAYSNDRIKALKAGFDTYITKPVDIDELLAVIESACRK